MVTLTPTLTLTLTPSPTLTLTTLQGDDAAFAPLAGAPARVRVLRTALLQRFNSLLARHLPLVHTGSVREEEHLEGELHLGVPTSLGGRLCALRGLIFLEVKLGPLKRALAATASEADHAAVSINRPNSNPNPNPNPNPSPNLSPNPSPNPIPTPDS